MKTLSKNWFTEHRIDLEYKQYVLLAYLSDVNRQFHEKCLYPALSELIDHYRNLKQFSDSAGQLYQSFPGELSAIDLENFRLSYRKVVENDQIMEELERIISFSLPRMEEQLRRGRDVYEELEHMLELETVGIRPVNTEHGYLMFSLSNPDEIRVYEYSVSLYRDEDVPYRMMHTKEIITYTRNLVNTPANIKVELIKQRREMPNPATFVVYSKLNIPFEQTLLPIGKRMLIREISLPRVN